MAHEPRSRNGHTRCGRAPSGRRLLIVDDEQAVVMSLTRFFGRRGWRVASASDSERARRLIETERFEAVLLDLALTPFGEEGLGLLALPGLKAAKTPVVLYTGGHASRVEWEARRLGVSAVVRKPQPLMALARLLDDLTEGSPASGSDETC
jgi:DNA-binding NtrC family response regulator